MTSADNATQGQVRPGRLTWIGFGLSLVILATLVAMHAFGFRDSWMLWGLVLMNVGNSSASVLRLPPRARDAILILGAIAAVAGIAATVMGK